MYLLLEVEFSIHSYKGVYETYVNFAELLANCILNTKLYLLYVQPRKLLQQFILQMLVTGLRTKN